MTLKQRPIKKVFLIMHKDGYVVKAIASRFQAKLFLRLTQRVHARDATSYHIQEHQLFSNWVRGW